MGKAKPERQKLNREFVKLKQGQTLIVKLLGYGEKKWTEFDDKTGEEKQMQARTLELMSDKGIKFRMFEDGGHKANSDVLEELMAKGEWFEIEHEGFEEITLKNGDPARVNKYGIYSAEAPAELKSA